MAVLLAAFLFFQPAALSPSAAADTTVRDTTVRDTTVRDTTVRDTTVRDTVRAVGIARPDTVLPLPAVHVEAKRSSRSVLEAPRHVTALTAEEIEASGARSAAELLEARTGLFVKRYGAGGLATLSARGTSSQQTLVLLDGLRAADPQTGQVDLSLLPTVLLRSVEVTHGAASAHYGSGALGGVVRLRTLRPTRQPVLNVSASAGAWGTRRGGAVVRGGAGGLTGLLAAEFSRSEGDFLYENEVLLGTPVVRRKGADRRAATLFGKVRYGTARRRLTLTGWYTDAERGLPGTTGAKPAQARQWDRHVRLGAQYAAQPGWGTLRAAARLQRTRRRYAGPVSADTARTERYTLSMQARRPVGERWLLHGGAEGAYEHAALRGGVGRLRAGAFLRATGDVGRLQVRPGVRLDAYGAGAGARRVVAVSPSLGVSVQPLAWKGLRLKGHVARAFRAPTLSERFYKPGGNPDLRAEDGLSAEGGAAVAVERQRWRAQAEVAVFSSWLRQQIVWRPSFVAPGVRGWRPQNVDRVRTRGAEASAEVQYRPQTAFQLGGGIVATRTEAEDRSVPAARAYGQQLPYVPPAQFKVHVNASWDAPAPLGTVRLSANGRLVARRYFTADETRAVPAYQVFEARLRYRQVTGPVQATLSLSAENLTDQAYEIIRRYPMPPRHARLQLTLQAAP